MSCNSDVRRMIETVSFNPYNFVDSFDESVFSRPHLFKIRIEGQKYTITINQTKDSILKKYSIFSMNDKFKTIQLVISNQDIPLFSQKEISKKEWLPVFMKFNQTTQVIGKIVREQISLLELEASTLKRDKEIIKDKELQVQACKKADKLVTNFCQQSINLEKEMDECGLTPLDIEAIKQNCAGIYDAADFCDRLSLLKLPKETTIIGLNHKEIIPGLREAVECEDYMDAYLRIFKDFRARDDFLAELTKEPHPIIFIVPHKLFGNKRGVTAKEMEWLLDNPTCMGQIHFVFRAYKTYSLKIVSPNLTKKEAESYREHLTVRIFQQMKEKLCLPAMTFDSQAAHEEWSIRRRKFEMVRIIPFDQSLVDGRMSLGMADEFAIVPLTQQMSSLSIAVVEELVEGEASTSTALSLTKRTVEAYKSTRAIFLMGGAGSGKGSVRDMMMQKYSERNFIVIDPDQIKELMPEYQEAIKQGKESAASEVHDKSVEIATKLLAAAINEKQNLIYDSTGSRFWIYEEQMTAARNQGMFVELIYVETDVETCLVRAQERGIKTGRFVPEENVRRSNDVASDFFADLHPYAHRVKKYNNDGKAPELVSTLRFYS